MTTLIALPIIRTKADLAGAAARLDIIIDAPGGSLEADERTALCDLIAAYEDRHPVIPRGGPLGVIRRLMATHDLTQRNLPEIGAQSVVSAVMRGKRKINARMAIALSRRFKLPVSAFIDAQLIG
jgi:HTH-type transcriptional regulator/antitoxin HigA